MYQFQLIPKGQTEAETINNIDEKLCQLLNREVDPKYYVAGWFDSIGFQIACGKPLGSQELRDKVRSWYDSDEEYQQSVNCRVLTYLGEHYTSRCGDECYSSSSH